MESCIDRNLLISAVSSSNVNATLLLDALTPLCPGPFTPPSLVQVVSNHQATIVAAYVCGFMPWGFLVLLDFISPKFKSVRQTRRAGRWHVVGSITPMIFVVSYAVIQGIAGDFQEMMTAISAILLTLYHMARSVWGMLQVNAYKEWCTHTLQCMLSAIGKSFDGDNYEPNLDDDLMLNDEIADNEFTGRDVSVKLRVRWFDKFSFDAKHLTFPKLSLPRFHLSLLNPELCTVRWAGAFLCAFGDVWDIDHTMTMPMELIRYLCRCTLPVPGTRSKLTHHSIRQMREE